MRFNKGSTFLGLVIQTLRFWILHKAASVRWIPLECRRFSRNDSIVSQIHLSMHADISWESVSALRRNETSPRDSHLNLLEPPWTYLYLSLKCWLVQVLADFIIRVSFEWKCSFAHPDTLNGALSKIVSPIPAMRVVGDLARAHSLRFRQMKPITVLSGWLFVVSSNSEMTWCPVQRSGDTLIFKQIKPISSCHTSKSLIGRAWKISHCPQSFTRISFEEIDDSGDGIPWNVCDLKLQSWLQWSWQLSQKAWLNLAHAWNSIFLTGNVDE
jgi:hypothetical protein